MFGFHSDFELLVVLNGRRSPSSGLFQRKTVSALSIDTLNIMTVAQLFKWDALAVAVRSDTPFQVLRDSTFSIVMHGRFIEILRKINQGRQLNEPTTSLYEAEVLSYII